MLPSNLLINIAINFTEMFFPRHDEIKQIAEYRHWGWTGDFFTRPEAACVFEIQAYRQHSQRQIQLNHRLLAISLCGRKKYSWARSNFLNENLLEWIVVNLVIIYAFLYTKLFWLLRMFYLIASYVKQYLIL